MQLCVFLRQLINDVRMPCLLRTSRLRPDRCGQRRRFDVVLLEFLLGCGDDVAQLGVLGPLGGQRLVPGEQLLLERDESGLKTFDNPFILFLHNTFIVLPMIQCSFDLIF